MEKGRTKIKGVWDLIRVTFAEILRQYKEVYCVRSAVLVNVFILILVQTL